MMDFTINFNMNKLDRLIKSMPNRLASEIAIGLTKGAIKVQNTAKIYSPYKTGNLRRSIAHKINNDLTASVGSNLVYARVREFNTKSRPTGYLRPALKSNKKYIEKVVQDHIKKAIK